MGLTTETRGCGSVLLARLDFWAYPAITSSSFDRPWPTVHYRIQTYRVSKMTGQKRKSFTEVYIYIYIYIIISKSLCEPGFPKLSYHSSLPYYPAGLLDYILCLYRAVVFILGRQTLTRPWAGFHRCTSLMSSSLFFSSDLHALFVLLNLSLWSGVVLFVRVLFLC